MPPSRASAIAILLSVTVSMAALNSGIFIAISFVSRVRISTFLGRIDDFCGTRSTSSNVSATSNGGRFFNVIPILQILLRYQQFYHFESIQQLLPYLHAMDDPLLKGGCSVSTGLKHFWNPPPAEAPYEILP